MNAARLVEPLKPAPLQRAESQPHGFGRNFRLFFRRGFARRSGGRRRGDFQTVEHVKSPPLRQRQHARGDFVHRILADFVAAIRAERAPGARIEQAQVIVYFRGRGHRRARVARRVLLLDGDGRGDARDFVHVGLLDPLEKLPRVGRKRFDVAPLPFGVDRVKRQARLARSGNSRDQRDRVVRNIEADVF